MRCNEFCCVKQNTAYEMRIRDWSSDVCSSDLRRKTQADTAFVERLVGQQRPDYFWVGCSDSRVPATEIVDLDPGEMFVHRNIANLTPAHDVNFNAALLFAVAMLRVSHVIVVGHYGCGGIRADVEGVQDEPIGLWLSDRKRTRRHS